MATGVLTSRGRRRLCVPAVGNRYTACIRRRAESTRRSDDGPRDRPGLVWLLLSAVTVPLVVLFAVTGLNFSRALAERRAAQQVSRNIELLTAAAHVYLPETLDRVDTVGFARLDELHMNRTVVRALTGIDPASLSAPNRVALDAGLDRLQRLLTGDGADAADREAAQRLVAIRARLHDLRVRFDEGQTTSADQLGAHRDLVSLVDSIVDETLLELTPGRAAPASLVQGAATVKALVTVARTANVEANAAFGRIVHLGDPATQPDLAIMVDRHHQALIDATRAAGPEQRALITKVARSAHEAAWEASIRTLVTQMPGGSFDGSSYSAGQIQVIARALSSHLDYFNDLDDATGQVMDIEADRAGAVADRARQSAVQAVVLLAVTALCTVAGAYLVGRRVIGPLRRLSSAAESISEGHLPTAPLPERGPSEVRSTTRAFNDLAGSLTVVEAAVHTLAHGDVEHPAEVHGVPGPLGESLRASLARLRHVTGRLRQSDAVASAIVGTAADAIWTLDANGVILTANEAAVAMLGRPGTDQIGHPLTDFLEDNAGQPYVISASGRTVPVLVSVSRGTVHEAGITAVFARDITERRELELQLAHQATHDSLTGLPNRTAVLQRIAAQLSASVTAPTAASRPAGEPGGLAVLFVDLDGFKAVNDTHGHGVGDQVLCAVASRMALLAGTGHLAARLGGDEFLVVSLAPTTERDAARLGQQLITELERPIDVGEATFSLSASVGVARSRPSDTDPLELIRRADEAAHLAKSRGRARVEVYRADMQARVEQQSAILLALRRAVRDGELELFLQPIMDLRVGRFPTAEALVRWRRDGVLVTAADFIPVAEQSSLINEISRWMIAESCRVLSRWNRIAGLEGRRIAVNVSSRHLMDDRFLSDLDQAIAAADTPPGQIELELTETRLLTDMPKVNRTLRSISARGITLAVDDFGAGYASMAYLRDLQVDVVKLDRQFVGRVGKDPVDQAIVTALLALSAALGFEVVAEGVESGEQMAFLAAHGCTRVQGHHIAQPMPVAECEQWLLAHLAPTTAEIDPASSISTDPSSTGALPHARHRRRRRPVGR